MPDPFATLHQTLFSGPLCEDVLLSGQPGRAFVDRNVEIIGEYGQVIGRRTVIDIPASHAAQQDDTVTIDGVAYALDKLQADDGYMARWIVRLEP